jgi:hypothetical protein
MKQITIPVTFNVSDEAYDAYHGCSYIHYLEQELADMMFGAFRKFVFMGSVNQEIIKLAEDMNKQFEEMEKEYA